MSSGEIFDVVDECDRVVGTASREDCHARGLIHRSVHVFVVDNEGRIMLQKRSKKKDLYPGAFNSSASGHLDSREGYDEAALRELQEELPSVDCIPQRVGAFKAYFGCDRENSMLYVCRHEGPVEYDKTEIDGVGFYSLREIAGMIASGQYFTPGTIKAFRLYVLQNKRLTYF